MDDSVQTVFGEEIREIIDIEAPGEKHHRTVAFLLRAAAFTAVLLPLFFGGKSLRAVLAVQVIFCALAALFAFVAAINTGILKSGFRLSITGKLLCILWLSFVFLALLQLVSFPVGVIELLSPHAAELYRMAGARTGTLSLDASRTMTAASWLIMLGALAFFLLALPREEGRVYLSGRRRMRTQDPIPHQARRIEGTAYFLQRAVCCSAALCAVLSILHWTFGAELLFGYFMPAVGPIGSSRTHWPFVNPNHLSVLLTACSTMLWGRILHLSQLRILHDAVDHRRTSMIEFLLHPISLRRYIPLTFALIVVVLGNILTLSRAGNFFMLVSLLSLWLVFLHAPGKQSEHVRKPGREERRWLYTAGGAARHALGVAAVVFFVLFFLGQSTRDQAAERIEYGLASGYDEGRRLLAHTSVDILRAYPLTGSGLGTWSYAAEHNIPRELAAWKMDYAHNDYLQAAAETGVIGSAVIIVAWGIVLIATLKTWRLPLIPTERVILWTSFAVLVCMSLHAFVDFPFHIPSLSFIWTLLFASHLRILGFLSSHYGAA